MKEKKRIGWIPLAAIALGVILAVIVVILVITSRKGTYRTVQVYESQGPAEVYRGSDDPVTPYVNMRLLNQDRVRTLTEGYLYLKLDGDKYMLAEPGTEFTLEAAGSSKNSRTRINLNAGSVVTHVTQPLSADALYEVITPTSTMAVRGTSFRVYVWTDEQGVLHAAIQIMDGSVEVHLIQPDGSMDETGRTVEEGHTVMIFQDDKLADYEGILDGVEYTELDIQTLEFLGIAMDNGKSLTIGRTELDALIRLKNTRFTVVFLGDDGKEFARQQVLYGKTVTPPMLSPTARGHWDYDFDEPVKRDLEIPWVME